MKRRKKERRGRGKERKGGRKGEEEEVQIEELYAKYKNFSYLHCEWKMVEELEQLGDKRAMTKLNRSMKMFYIQVAVESSAAAKATANAPPHKAPPSVVEWSKVEESDFMRILRNNGVKDDTNSQNMINLGRFRELPICLHKKKN
ncbi:hypothetical protein niasHT_031458 [Heterodera trifolii]|uniref:Uncharacterized protein n=1 Tax=Heterodera trifolii TaxID=157864 RepID=A0ABD2IXA4_9BILA